MKWCHFSGERLLHLDAPGFSRVSIEDILLSERMLSIACDVRYDAHDIRQVTGVLIKRG